MVGSGYGTVAALFLAGAMALSGCGGGDGGPSRPGARIAAAGQELEERKAGPEPRDRVTGPQDDGAPVASAWAASVLGRADGLFATSVHAERGTGMREVGDVGCSGLGCSGSGAIGLGNAGPLADARVFARTAHIDLVWGSDLDGESWGGWMRHAGFGVLLERAPEAEDIGGVREFRYGLAVGGLTESARGPDMNAVWRGRMVGMAALPAFADERLEGEAELAWRSVGSRGEDAEDGDVVGRIDAAFTGIESVATGASFPDARFPDVPVRLLDVTKTEVEAADGMQPDEEPGVAVVAKMAFDAGVAGNRIRGGFFGPEGVEAAGVFEHNGMVGAFGATRE